MAELEQIVKDKEAIKGIFEVKHKEIYNSLVRLYGIFEGSGIDLNFKKGDSSWQVNEQKGHLVILCEDKYPSHLFSVIANKSLKHFVYIGTGYDDTNQDRKYYVTPVIPEGRVLPNKANGLLEYKKKWYTGSATFFTLLYEAFLKEPTRVNAIIKGLESIPDVIAEKVANLKQQSLELANGEMGNAIEKIKNNSFSEKELLLHLYVAKPEVFMLYFGTLRREDRILVCKDILNSSCCNAFVNDWLSKEYANDVTEAWRDIATNEK